MPTSLIVAHPANVAIVSAFVYQLTHFWHM
jgi:hypothetical protein